MQLEVRFLLVLVWVTTAATYVGAQVPYVLSLEAVEGTTVAPTLVRVVLDSGSGDFLSGWSLGVAHDPTELELLGAYDGATTETVNGGVPPEFSSYQIHADGWAVGVVISFMGTAELAPGNGYELHLVDYSPLATDGDCVEINFSNLVGSPPVAVVVVTGVPMTASIQPDQYGLCETPPPPGPVIGGGGVAFMGDTIEVVHQIFESTGLDSQGFSLAMTNNPDVVAPLVVIPVGVVADLNGGAGPDFFTHEVFPNGWTAGCVYSFFGAETVSFNPAQDVVMSRYGILGPGSLDLEWADGVLGNPPVSIVLVAGGASITLEGEAPEIEVLPNSPFVRGDCNDDALVDVADVIYIIAAQFPAQYDPALYPVDCGLACDANGDMVFDLADAVFLVDYRFQGGSPPSAPFPDCDVAAGQSRGGCEAYLSCP